MTKKKICIVTPLQYGGGAEYQISCLIDALASLGRYEVSFIVHHTDPKARVDNYKLFQIGQDGRMPKLGYIMDARSLIRTLRSISPDVVYQRVGCAYTGICAYYARRAHIPLVWHVAHDSDVSGEDNIYGGNPIRRSIEKRCVEYGIRQASHIVTQSRHQAALLEHHYGRKVSAVIPNFQPAPAETLHKSDDPLVVWVANLKPWKRPEIFVRLAAKLNDLANVRFVMVGAPSTGSGDRVWSTALMDSIKQTKNLEYVGKLSQDDVNRLFARSRVFVNTSIQEGFPNTFIQSWMREVPVVSLSVNPDNVLETEGVGFHADTEDKLASTVRSLVTDRVLCRQYASRAKDYAMHRHSMRNAFELAKLVGMEDDGDREVGKVLSYSEGSVSH